MPGLSWCCPLSQTCRAAGHCPCGIWLQRTSRGVSSQAHLHTIASRRPLRGMPPFLLQGQGGNLQITEWLICRTKGAASWSPLKRGLWETF